MDTLYNIIGWASIIGIIYYFYNRSQKEKERLAEAARQQLEYEQQIERDYKQALKESDKAHALELGRLYYGLKREGHALTIYDEQALTNDLSTMK